MEEKMKVSSADLMHHRLQAFVNTHVKISNILVLLKVINQGKKEHMYRIGEHEVPVDAIESLEMEEVEEE